MSDRSRHEEYMQQVLDLCEDAKQAGDCPVASIIVRDDQVIGRGANRRATGGDPTAHAEIEAIRDAARRSGSPDLSGATLYSAMEPCPMCCWAIKEAGINRIVLGARHAGMRRTDYGDYSVEGLIATTKSSLEVVNDIKVEECENMRRSWKHWVEPTKIG